MWCMFHILESITSSQTLLSHDAVHCNWWCGPTPLTLWNKAREKYLREFVSAVILDNMHNMHKMLQNLPKTWVVTFQFCLSECNCSVEEKWLKKSLPAASGLGNQTRWWQTGHEASFSCHDQRRLLPPDYFLAADKLLSGQHDNRRPTSLFSPTSHHLHRQTPRENDETARVHRILVVSWGKSNCIVLREILVLPKSA